MKEKTRRLRKAQLTSFMRYLAENEKSRATCNKYLHDLRHFYAAMGETGEVTRARVLNYKESLAQCYELTSANSMLAALNCFFRFLGWQDLCVRRFPIQRDAYCKAEKELSREEYVRLLTAARGKGRERLYLIIETICATGIRVSELRHVTAEAVREGEARVRCKGKMRRVLIPRALQRKLLAYMAKEKVKTGSVFITKNGTCVNRSNIWRDMKALCNEAGVLPSKVFPHNLRHLFARTFYGIERDIAKLADVLGHASIDTTRVYIMTSGEEHKRALARMHLIL